MSFLKNLFGWLCPQREDSGGRGDFHQGLSYEELSEIADFIKTRTSHRPVIGIICGSGIGCIAEGLKNKEVLPYESIPHFPTATVQYHAGLLILGTLNGIPVLCMQGRFHAYEGYPLWKGFVGESPLRGTNDSRFGPRFFAMSNAYDKKWRESVLKAAPEIGLGSIIQEGVYVMVGGPNFETPAELKALMTLGVDAVGMSTVHEVLVAKQCGMAVFAFSLITNVCLLENGQETEEAIDSEVVEVGKKRHHEMEKLVTYVVREMTDGLRNGSKVS